MINGDARISYAIYGAGSPLVLLHGGLSSGLDWVGEIPALSQLFKVIVIDLRGHAQSTPGNEEFNYSLLASDVVVVLDELDIDRASIAGWSDGGNVGLLFALNYPTRIDRLIAISANFHPDGVSDDVMQQIVDTPDRAGSLIARWLYRLQTPSPDWPQLQSLVTRMWQSRPTLVIGDLSRISVPTLLVVGARDNIEREHSEAMATAIPNAQLLIRTSCRSFGTKGCSDVSGRKHGQVFVRDLSSDGRTGYDSQSYSETPDITVILTLGKLKIAGKPLMNINYTG